MASRKILSMNVYIEYLRMLKDRFINIYSSISSTPPALVLCEI